MVIIQGQDDSDAKLYGYLVLIEYKCNLNKYLDQLESIDTLDVLDIGK